MQFILSCGFCNRITQNTHCVSPNLISMDGLLLFVHKFDVFNSLKYLKLIMQPLWQICTLIMPCFCLHLAFSYPLLIELSQLGCVNFFSHDSFPSSESFPSVFSSGSCLIHVCALVRVHSLQEGPCHEQPLWSIPLLLSITLLDL